MLFIIGRISNYVATLVNRSGFKTVHRGLSQEMHPFYAGSSLLAHLGGFPTLPLNKQLAFLRDVHRSIFPPPPQL